MILEDASATGMGFDRGGTVVIGSLLASTHFQYAYQLVRCNMGLEQMRQFLQLDCGGFRRD